MFTDIVKSTDLIEAIGDEAWTDLLRWHDHMLRSLFVSHDGEEVNHTGDGFFVAFEMPSSAIECAIAIQRTLVDHRRTHGFSPQVRVGLHLTGPRGKGAVIEGRVSMRPPASPRSLRPGRFWPVRRPSWTSSGTRYPNRGQ